MTATPTPGDLSARLQHLIDASECTTDADTDEEATFIPVKIETFLTDMREAIAALSALPAAGGEMDGAMAVAVGTPCEKHSGENAPSLDWWLQHTNRCTVCDIEARLESTTPQPSAAEAFTEKHCVDLRGIKVGEVLTAEQWEAVCAFVREQDAIIDAREDAAVGAQGDGDLPFASVQRVVRALTRLGVSTPCSQEEQAARAVELVNELCAEVGRHFDALSAAPAAGKGVDANAALCAERHGDVYERAVKKAGDFADLMQHGQAALTRQPVAGENDNG